MGRIPTKWSQVTIRQWLELKQLTDTYKDKGADLAYIVKQIAIMADVREEIVRAMPIDKAKSVANKLSFLVEEIPGKAKASFKVKGKKYKPVLDLSTINAGKYIDLVEYSGDPENNVHEILALMVDGKDSQEERAHLFYHHLTMDIAYPLSVFFYAVWNHFIGSIAASSIQESLKTMGQIDQSVKIPTTNIGDGLLPSTTSRVETEQNGITFWK